MRFTFLFGVFPLSLALNPSSVDDELAPRAGSAKPAPLHKAVKGDDVLPGKYIVKLKRDTNSSHLEAILSRFSGETDHVYGGRFHGFSRSLSEQELDAMLNHEHVGVHRVEYVAEDSMAVTSSLVQNFDSTWGLSNISHYDEWLGPEGYTYIYDDSGGQGTCTYVIDSGIESQHPGFGGRAEQIKSFVPGQTRDDTGHGTHVAGIIGSYQFGVAKQTKLYGVKVFDKKNTAPVSRVIEAVEFVTRDMAKRDCPKGVFVNLAFEVSLSQALNDAVSNLINMGTFVGVSTGNSHLPADKVSPASEPAVCVVGAIDEAHRPLGYSPHGPDGKPLVSEYGPRVDVFAPGENIRSLGLGGSEGQMSGSSQATGFVVGIAAYLATLEAVTGTKLLCERIKSLAVIGAIGNLPKGTPGRFAFNGAHMETKMVSDVSMEIRGHNVFMCNNDDFKPPCKYVDAPAGTCVDMYAADMVRVSSLRPSRNAGTCRFYRQFKCTGRDSFETNYDFGGEKLDQPADKSLELPSEPLHWVRVTLGSGITEGTYDNLELNFAGQGGPNHVVARSPDSGFNDREEVDLKTVFKHDKISLRRIRHIQLTATKTKWAGGDEWFLQGIHFRAFCGGQMQRWVENRKFATIGRKVSQGRSGRGIGHIHVAWQGFTGPEDWAPEVPCSHFSNLWVYIQIAYWPRAGTDDKVGVEFMHKKFDLSRNVQSGTLIKKKIDVREVFPYQGILHWGSINYLKVYNEGGSDDVKIDRQCSGIQTFAEFRWDINNWIAGNDLRQTELDISKWYTIRDKHFTP
ncbi:hypothetical protein L249_5172 [Ophiocordyceps polyrhachis-furcata BCC 54312]|uniref:Peptidase S8/S53 domain-containing protein n=1 Tax=Ophiocordyceps polyrhachis-furcata BCC 54312 TaxID=1330021 RepID=A0A367L8H5_9HYPO|nr:hypothetical protein L249_5172 [Ophiocordyceps polyrhachis-furcata BCC 54312]